MKTDTAYRKRFWPLPVWMVALLFVMLAPALIFDDHPQADRILKIMLPSVMVMLDVLLFLIWKLEAVYWFSGGPDFEAAKAAGPEVRKRYAWRHLKRFLIATVPVMLYFLLSTWLLWPFWTDTLVFFVAVLAAAFSTVRIRFE